MFPILDCASVTVTYYFLTPAFYSNLMFCSCFSINFALISCLLFRCHNFCNSSAFLSLSILDWMSWIATIWKINHEKLLFFYSDRFEESWAERLGWWRRSASGWSSSIAAYSAAWASKDLYRWWNVSWRATRIPEVRGWPVHRFLQHGPLLKAD